MTLSRDFTPNPKNCLHCGKEFLPQYTAMQVCCSLTCAARFAKNQRVAKVKAEREQTRERKAALKRIPDLIKEAQREFNSWVRARDAKKPCISCGASLGEGGVGGGYDCGHFRSTGSAPHLRFDERNAAGQCKHCNRYLSGNAVAYRVGLVERIGLEAVSALEADNRVRKWGRDELIAIRDHYKAKLKELTSMRKETA